MFNKKEIKGLREEVKKLNALLRKHNVFEKERRLQEIIKNKTKNN